MTEFINGRTVISLPTAEDRPFCEAAIEVALSYGRKDVAIDILGESLDDSIAGVPHE